MKGYDVFSQRVDIGFGLFLTKREIHERFNALLGGMILRAISGDEASATTLQEVHRLLRGDLYVDPPPGVARVIRFYHLMLNLSLVVQPTNGNTPAVINAPIELNEACGMGLSDVYRWAKQHWKRGNTLRSLTIRVFL